MDPFRILPRCRAKTLPLRSGTQRAIESDGRERADHGGDRIEFGDLPVWIEERYEKKPGKTASQGPKRDLNGNESWPAGAAVTVSQMPLAAGTCGHRFAEGNRRKRYHSDLNHDRCRRREVVFTHRAVAV